MYQFKDDIDNSIFFKFAKSWVIDMNWAMLSLSAKAILPVIGCHLNDKGEAWPAENTIAALAGLTPKTTRKAINVLTEFPGFSYKWYVTPTGRRSKRFSMVLPGKEKPSFFFYRTVINGGNWRLIKPISKAVYVVMRAFSGWDVDSAEIDENSNEEIRSAYATRWFDHCEMQPGDIGRYAGIYRTKVFEALRDLQEHSLIERDNERWKVYRLPPHYYKRAYLNTKLMKDFGHELNQ